jgi:DNA modification methylase
MPHKGVRCRAGTLLRLQTSLVGREVANGGSTKQARAFSDPAFGSNKSAPLHRWVPWIAGFSGEFVADALSRHLTRSGTVLDPFCGVGTTLVESIKRGHRAIGFEINPYAALAARTKTRALRVDATKLSRAVHRFDASYEPKVSSGYAPRSQPPTAFKTRGVFYSPLVLRKVLILQDFIDGLRDETLKDLFRLAFAATMVTYSNYSYEPSLGQRKSAGRENVEDFAVGQIVSAKLHEMLEDVRSTQKSSQRRAAGRVIEDSFFRAEKYLDEESVDLIITSPPYLNNYHYNRNTRPHLYWLGFVESPADMKPLEDSNFGKYWQTVRELETLDPAFSLPNARLSKQLSKLRKLNGHRGIYGGNGWANYATSYFNDCYRFVLEAKRVLKRGSTALVVIGNSIIQGEFVPTDQYLGEIAGSVGLELVDIHRPRATRVGNSIIQSGVRVAKAKNTHQLYEAVVELRKP